MSLGGRNIEWLLNMLTGDPFSPILWGRGGDRVEAGSALSWIS